MGMLALSSLLFLQPKILARPSTFRVRFRLQLTQSRNSLTALVLVSWVVLYPVNQTVSTIYSAHSGGQVSTEN